MASIAPMHNDQERRKAIASALVALRGGDCVAVPTETVYGLAGEATSRDAVARIFALKGRPSFNPLICHVDGMAMAQRFGRFDGIAQRLASEFWPGPLTLVVPKGDERVADAVTAGLDSIAIRWPAGVMADLAGALGRPLAAPSANRSGRISPTTARHVADEYRDVDLLVLDGGPCPVGLESTIVKITSHRLVLLRPGVVTAAELASVSGLPVERPDGTLVEAPGMLESHYAPAARVRLNVTNCPAGAALLAFGSGDGKRRKAAGRMLNLSESGDLREAGANLYAMMKSIDESGAALICVEPIPEEGPGIAINDRLRRAAAPRKKDAVNAA